VILIIFLLPNSATFTVYHYFINRIPKEVYAGNVIILNIILRYGLSDPGENKESGIHAPKSEDMVLGS